MNKHALSAAMLIAVWTGGSFAQATPQQAQTRQMFAAGRDVEANSPQSTNNWPTFGVFEAAERVRIVDPVRFVVGDSIRLESELVVITIAVRDPSRVLPQNRQDDAYLVGSAKALVLAYPIFDARLVLLVPAATPTPAATIWRAPGHVEFEKMQVGEIEALHKRLALSSPSNVIVLPQALGARTSTAIRTFADVSELNRAIAQTQGFSR